MNYLKWKTPKGVKTRTKIDDTICVDTHHVDDISRTLEIYIFF